MSSASITARMGQRVVTSLTPLAVTRLSIWHSFWAWVPEQMFLLVLFTMDTRFQSYSSNSLLLRGSGILWTAQLSFWGATTSNSAWTIAGWRHLQFSLLP